jgi:hypothetical protein
MPTLKDKSFLETERKMLPLSNNIYYPSDLTENAIQLIGENDGIFDKITFCSMLKVSTLIM